MNNGCAHPVRAASRLMARYSEVSMRSAFLGRARRPGSVTEEPGEDLGFAGPGLLQGFSRDASSGIAQGQRHHHDVVEWADDRKELGDEVDGREHPQTGDGHGQLGPPWNPRVMAETSDGDRT